MQHRIRIADADIYAEEHGKGTALVLLHGVGRDMSLFRMQSPEFSREFRVIGVDLRGHGRSGHGEEDLSVRLMSEDLIHVLDKLEIEQAVLLGCSDGAAVAMRTAFMHPQRVLALVLTGAVSNPHGMRWKAVSALKRESFALFFKAMRDEKAALRRELVRLRLREPNFPAAALASIKVPTLLTAGEEDIVQREHTEYLSRKIKNSVIRFFPGGHSTPEILPEEYNRAVLDFLHTNGLGNT